MSIDDHADTAAHGLPEPVRGDDPAGLRGVGGDVRPPRRLRRGSTRASRRAGSGSRTGCTPQSPSTPSTRSCSSTPWSPEPGELPSLRRPTLARFRVPAPQRLRLSQCEPGHRRGDTRPPGRAVRRAGRPLLRALERALRALAGEGRGRHERARRARSPGDARSSRTSRSSPRAAGSDRATLSFTRTTACSRASTASSSTTSSSSISATRRTSSSTSGAERRFPDISDQTIAKMVSAIDVLVLRPDDELRRLARLAVELGVSEQVASAAERGRARREPSRAAMPANGGSPTSSRRRTRGSTSPAERASSTTTTARGSTTPGSRSRRSAPTSRDSTPARTSHALAEAMHSPSGSASPRSTARCSRRSCARPSTRASRSPARCSRTSRTTTSTSTTATSRSSGTRCASSVRSWRATGSSRTGRTSSSSATTRCARLWRSSGSTGARAGQGWRAARSVAAARGAAEGDLRRDVRVGASLRRSALCPRRSPTRSRSCSGGSRTSACETGSRPTATGPRH